jgi:hypothetical protein
LVEKRQAVEKAKLKSIENGTNASLEKLREDYQTIIKFQSSFSYVAIITVIVMIFTIISIDLCRMVSYLKEAELMECLRNYLKKLKGVKIKTEIIKIEEVL